MESSSMSESEFMRFVNVKLVGKNGKQIDEFQMRYGTNLWVFIRKRGHAIGAACSGVGVCAACHVEVIGGKSDGVSEQSEFEKDKLSQNNISPNQRLACLCRVFDDVTIKADYW